MPNILLIPTSFERRLIENALRMRLGKGLRPNEPNSEWAIELCGFGLIAAAALTAEAIAKLQPARVLLMGIAGSLNDSVTVGTAVAFDRVTCHGIGVGECLDRRHQSAASLGWPQCETTTGGDAIGDSLPLSMTGVFTDPTSPHQHHHLISVPCASADSEEAVRRSDLFVDAAAEDMEGFGAAVACARANIPITIIRGISNRAGERNHSQWQIEGSLNAAVELAIPLIQGTPARVQKEM